MGPWWIVANIRTRVGRRTPPPELKQTANRALTRASASNMDSTVRRWSQSESLHTTLYATLPYLVLETGNCELQRREILTFTSSDFQTAGLFGTIADRSAFGLGIMSAVYFSGLCVA